MTTKGGPNNSTNILVYETYQKGSINNIGMGAVLSVLLLFIVAGLIFIQFKFINRKAA